MNWDGTDPFRHVTRRSLALTASPIIIGGALLYFALRIFT